MTMLNLVQHRAGPSIWDREPAAEWDAERWVLALVAAAFLLAGLRQRSVPGCVLALGGGMLGWWAATGIDTRRLRRAQLKQVWPERHRGDLVVEASEESFPASDAPAWTPTTGNR